MIPARRRAVITASTHLILDWLRRHASHRDKLSSPRRPAISSPTETPKSKRSPWSWIPTLYFAQGLPYVLVNKVSPLLYARLQVSVADIGFYTGLLGIPWVIKPLWSPLVDLYWTKRKWAVLTQFLLALSFAGTAATLLSGDRGFWWYGSLLSLGLAAMLSATHDIGADGFYMEALDEHRQSMFVGIRSTFFRFALIFGQGILIIWAGNIESHTGPPPIPITITAAQAGATPDSMPEATAPQTNLRLEPTNLALVAGTTATITARLMSAPETTISMNLYRKNKSVLSMLFPAGTEMKVRIDKGDRISFGPDNWDKPQSIIVAADASLKDKVTVQFNATAGNVQLTYAICFGAMALLLLMLGSYHAFALPAAEIHAISPTRAPFSVALGVIALVVAIPVAIFWSGYEGLYWVYEQILGKRPENLYKFLAIVTVCALIWGALMIPQIRKKLNASMGVVADKTGFPFDEIFLSFFQKHGIGLMLGYLLLFRLGENMLTTMLAPFLTNPRSTGGMGLTTSEYGTAYGTIGIVLQVVGGIMGGVIIASIGLRKMMIPMCLILNVPHLLYLYLAATLPESRALIYACIGAETFCYGFAFTSYMVYMLYVAGQGKHKTSHFAICTGFMALGVTFPGMISGLIQELLKSWTSFYMVVFLAGIPGLLLIPFLPLEHGFGKKKEAA